MISVNAIATAKQSASWKMAVPVQERICRRWFSILQHRTLHGWPAHRCAEGVQLDGRALTLPLQAETEQVTIAVPDSAVTLHTGPYSAVVSRVIRDLDASIVLLRPEHQNTPLLRTALPKNAPAEPGQTIRFDLRPEACLCYPSEQARAAAFK